MSERATSAGLHTRRALLGGAAAAAVASPLFGGSRAFGQEGEDTSDTDSEVLVGLIGYEQQTVVAFKAAIDSGTLGDFAATANLFADQNRTHAKFLTQQLEQIGGKPKPGPRTSDVPGLTEQGSKEEFLAYLIRSSNQLVAAYVEGQKDLGNGDLEQLAAQCCANVGQHLVVLRQQLGLNPLPSALPSGSETH